MENIKQEFLKAISETFQAYNKYGARSNKKLIPIHSWLANVIGKRLGKNYTIRSLGNGGEIKVEGKYYPKRLDVAVIKDRAVIATVSFKFVTSNLKQNVNNYFEQLLGETANIRRVNIGFAHFLVLRGHTPYFDKNKGSLRGKTQKIETLNENDLAKYVKLFQDIDFPHKPDVLGIATIDLDEKEEAFFLNLEKFNLSLPIKEVLLKKLSVDNFIQKTVALCKIKS